jgi:hypothetical protein
LLGNHEDKEVKQMECFHFNSIEISTYLGSIFLFRNSSYMKVKQSNQKKLERIKMRRLSLDLPRANCTI